MTSLNPVKRIGWQLEEAVCSTTTSRARGAPRAVDDPQGGRDPARRRAGRRLSASVLGRHAAARDDRDGADQQARGAHRRRADHGARRHDPGADPPSDGGLQKEHGIRDRNDHPRPRRRRRARRRRARHVRRARRRAGTGRRPVHEARDALHVGLAGIDAAASTSSRSGWSRFPGQPPSLLQPPTGCAFHPRCAYAFDRCRAELPELRPSPVGTDHRFGCHLGDEDRARIWAQKKAAWTRPPGARR